MNKRIYDNDPNNWQELEEMVCQAFIEMRYKAQRNYEVDTIRGKVKVDIYAVNENNPISTVVLCECKYWNKPVSQNVVYAFRSICADIGAHHGLIISKKGFQSGAEKTRESTNVHLLDFTNFQETYYDEWRQGVFMSFAKMDSKLRHLIPYNPHSTIDKNLLHKYDPFALWNKYSFYWGDHGYANYFIGNQEFPVNLIDPRGDPNNKNEIIISSHREYFEIGKQAYNDACKIFNL
jgi:hypothetical protein